MNVVIAACFLSILIAAVLEIKAWFDNVEVSTELFVLVVFLFWLFIVIPAIHLLGTDKKG